MHFRYVCGNYILFSTYMCASVRACVYLCVSARERHRYFYDSSFSFENLSNITIQKILLTWCITNSRVICIEKRIIQSITFSNNPFLQNYLSLFILKESLLFDISLCYCFSLLKVSLVFRKSHARSFDSNYH